MNRVKSVFVMAFFALLTVVSIQAVIHLGGGFSPGWLGALLASAPMLLVLGLVMLGRKLPADQARLTPVSLTMASGALLAAFDWVFRAGSLAAASLAGLCLAAYATYQFWYSRLDRSASRIENGQPLPEFSALNLDGKPVYSRDLLGKPALLMFYRGNWCPFCVVQVKELAAAYRELGDRARIVLISPQPARKTRELAARFDVPFDFWVDTDNQAATVLGINHDQGLPAGMQVLGYDTDTVLPTSVVLAADGTVLNVDETENYRDRAEPGFLAKVLERHGL
ncbi:MAG: peroxiredoxin family protein [Gammaproteobacteria bacterium]|nr:peroxiredoxin family protein [Gammaproteobacteria bacterium]MCZ6763292.1 peroxiredoxin family protein [Gammaproteobacteria bacterium]MCZ6881260.1 peroxiredoxin family protein [Gammaproteobacteria bacterium]